MLFKYKAISSGGTPIEGTIEAKDENDAVMELKKSVSIITSIKKSQEGLSLLDFFNKKKSVNDKDLSLVCKQFAIILKAGLPLVKAIELVAEQVDNKDLATMLNMVGDDVSAGHSLADSFAVHGANLPTTFVEAIRAGEESGSLNDSFDRMSDYFEKQYKIKGKVKGALTYPAFVLVVAAVVIFVIMEKAVPIFMDSFGQMGVEMPLPTLALVAFSNFCSKFGLIIAAIAVAAFLGYKYYASTDKGALNVSKFKLRLPVIGKIELMNAASEYARTFSTMITSNVPVMNALIITARSMTNRYLGESVHRVAEGLESGYTIGGCLKKEGTLPDLLIEMTSIGENSGLLESTLNVVSEYYDNEVDTATSKAMTLLEPMIICVLAVFVLWILLAIYGPMFSLYDSI